jgi:uncharacterized membrane protein
MSELIVVGFHGKHRAAEVLDQLQELHETWAVDLKDGVAAYRRENGKLRVEQSLNVTSKEGAGLGGALGLILGALFMVPFTAGTSAAVAAAAIGANAATVGTIGAVVGFDEAIDWKDRYGISEDFVNQVGGMVQPGDSAVFALLTSSDPEQVAQRFAHYGGTVIRTTLKPSDAVRLQETLRP